MISTTRLIIKAIDHTKEGPQLTEDDAYVYYPSSLTLSTEARVSAAQLTGELPVVGGLIPEPGSMCILEVSHDGGEFVRVFVGFIFTYDVDRWGVVSFTAYDAIRYLQNPVSGKWVGKDGVDVSDIVRDVVRSCGLKGMADTMQLEKVGVKPIRLLKVAEKGIDVIDEVLEWAQLKSTATENGVTTRGGTKYAATKPANRWVLIDNCGTLLLCTAKELTEKVLGLKEPPIIGSGAGIIDFKMNVSIDNSANQVWLLRASETGMSGWKGEDPENVKRWGPVTYYEKIENAYCRNDEQMILRTAIMLCTKDCETRSIDISALGIIGLRAGMLVRIDIPWLDTNYFGEISKSKLVYLDSVSHTFNEGEHTMTMKCEALPGDVDLDTWNDLVSKVQRQPLSRKTSKMSKSNSKTNVNKNEPVDPKALKIEKEAESKGKDSKKQQRKKRKSELVNLMMNGNAEQMSLAGKAYNEEFGDEPWSEKDIIKG